MNRDKMIEALASRLEDYRCGRDGNTAMETAAAVLDLCGPEPLVWEQACADFHRANVLRGCYEVYGVDGDWWAMLMVNGTGYCISRSNATPDLAQAAAQSHATAAHWASTPLGKLVGVV